MEAEEPAGWQISLKKELRLVDVPNARHALYVTVKQPVMNGRDHEGPAWKPRTFLNVFLGGKEAGSPILRIDTLKLPIYHDLVAEWGETFKIHLDSRWLSLCLRLEAVREDYHVTNTGHVMVFRTDEPHTSGHTAAIGAALVPLVDALVHGDDDDDSDDEGAVQKRCRLDLERALHLVKKTRVFHERVKLQVWRLPGPGREPTNVVCGTVGVLMYVTEDDDLHG